MIFGLDLTLFLYLLLAAIYNVLRTFSPRAALLILVLANSLLLYVANPILSFYLLGQVILTGIVFVLLNRVAPKNVKAWPWVVFLGLIPVNLQIWFGKSLGVAAWFGVFGTLGWKGVFWTLGSTFFVVKSFVILKEALKNRRLDVLPALAALTFIPSFSAGPIHGMEPWRPERHASAIPWRKAVEIFLKIGWGAAALFVLAPWLKGLAVASAALPMGKVLEIYLGFAALYFDFSGYSLLAIATGAMFGVTLPENFNRPYLATNIQQFWQRWHMSLNAFIGTYLFKPFVRATGSPRKGIFLAFICAGLWHKFSLGYLAWGIGHGTALSVFMKPPGFWTKFKSRLPAPLAKALAWFMTMTWVALLSYSATHSPY